MSRKPFVLPCLSVFLQVSDIEIKSHLLSLRFLMIYFYELHIIIFWTVYYYPIHYYVIVSPYDTSESLLVYCYIVVPSYNYNTTDSFYLNFTIFVTLSLTHFDVHSCFCLSDIFLFMSVNFHHLDFYEK